MKLFTAIIQAALIVSAAAGPLAAKQIFKRDSCSSAPAGYNDCDPYYLETDGACCYAPVTNVYVSRALS